MIEWAAAWWAWFEAQPTVRQSLIVGGVALIVMGSLSWTLWSAIETQRYRGRRRHGTQYIGERRHKPRHVPSPPDLAHPAYAMPWDGTAGAHRNDTEGGTTRLLHPGHTAMARASVELSQTRLRLDTGWRERMAREDEEHVRTYGREYIAAIRAGQYVGEEE